MVNSMKVPQTVRTYCPSCKAHREHKVERVKTAGRRATSALKAGTRYRTEKLHKGYGGSPYPKIEHGSKYGAKNSQKVMLRFTCQECGKKHQNRHPQRAKKFEILKK